MNNADITRMLRWGAPAIGVLAAVVVYFVLGLELAILVLAGTVLLLVVFVLWNSLQALTGETSLSLEEALSLAAPTTEEEQKRSVLRTLKDLEYERSVGKISEEDYRDLVRTYRARAKELIRTVDEEIGQSREQAERLLQKRLRRERASVESSPAKSSASPEPAVRKAASDAGVASPVDAADGVDDSQPISEPEPSSDHRGQTPSSSPSAGLACPECDTQNDSDARFCKSCGISLEEAS